MKRPGTVGDFMSTNLILFAPDTKIHQAITTLVDNKISGAPVVDQNRKLVGILTKKDCLRIAFSTSYHKDEGGLVSEYMTDDPDTVFAQEAIVEIADRFLKSNFKRYPVVNDGRLVGIISRHDVLVALQTLW